MARDDGDDVPPPPPQAHGSPVEPDVIDVGDDSPALSTGVERISIDELDHRWTDYFRYTEAYQDQVDAIQSFLSLLADNGYYVMEGACGTGKTLAALVGGIHAVRDRAHLASHVADDGSFPAYSRILAVTPLKQQLQQFVEEMRGINRALLAGEEAVTTVTLRGRADMMPYARSDVPPFDEDGLGEHIDDMREVTRELIRFDSGVPLDWPDGMTPPAHSRFDYEWENASEEAEQIRDAYKYDPHRAMAVVRNVQQMWTDSDDDNPDRLVVDGVETPYPDVVPTSDQLVDESVLTAQTQGPEQLSSEARGRFDPFYAGFFAYEGSHPVSFDKGVHHVLDQDSLFEAAASRGMCPHETMADLAGQAEVVIGNYYHLFDPETRLLTDDKIGLIDDQTITIVDEAHQIERRVRDMLSSSVDLYTLDRAIADVEIAKNYALGELEGTPTPDIVGQEAEVVRETAVDALQTIPGYSVSVGDLKEVEELFRFAKQKLGTYGAECLNKAYSNTSWQTAVDNWGPDEQERGLSDPDNPSADDTLTADALATETISRETFYKAYPVMLGVKFLYDALADDDVLDRTPQGVSVGALFRDWVAEDGVEYHRELVLDDRPKESVPNEFPDWVRGWTPKFQLFNCIPSEELQAVFGELGGGVLMSATLQPADVFSEAVGIDGVPYPGDEESDEDDPDESDETAESEAAAPAVPQKPSADSELDTSDTRPTAFEQYPLRFDAENRLSMTVPLPKYTNRNRGRPTTDRDEMTSVRRQYADFLESAVKTKGNILVTMPNYREAEWAYNYLGERDIDKPLYLDQSSSSLETERQLETFFDSGGVMFTSARGTITEGVDYDGDKLHGCIAVGIPLLPTNSPRIQAVREAYDRRIDAGSGFETALTIPAVRKVRQALGRVIRGSDEAGVRVLADERFSSTGFSGVKEYLSDQEQAEFESTGPEIARAAMAEFWDDIADRELGSGADEVTHAQSESPSDDEASSTTLGALMETAEESDQSATDKESVSETSTPASGGRDIESVTTETAKMYFGSDATLSGWTEVPVDLFEAEIAPLVRQHTVDDDDDAVQLNFASELSVSGWTTVDKDIVHDEIEPLVEAAQ